MEKPSLKPCMAMLLALGALWTGGGAGAAETDISNTPLASASNTVVKPNVMFILDDSGSMNSTYTPDAADDWDSDEYGYRSSHCNGLYYNPSTVYLPPVNADGTSFGNAVFSDAKDNGFDPDSTTRSLNNRYYFTYTGTATTLGFTYDADGDVITNTNFYRECNSDEGDSPGVSKFTKHTLTTSSSAAAKTNFANWYSYYRTRMLTMKTSVGRAFKTINSNYRVGYSTILYTGTDSSHDGFLKVDDFTTEHKASFYTKLYNASPGGNTPLRAALSKAGRLYAGKLLTGADDPVQYSCQQNFTILSTDGYWNTNDESSSYGPAQLDGSTDVGNADATESRPQYDGTTVTSVVRTTATITVSGNGNTSVTSVKVNGTEILSGATNDNTSSSTVATRIAAAITRNGYTASASGNVVTIVAPTSGGQITFTPVITKTGTTQHTLTPTAFASSTTTTTTGGATSTLADIAAYYYNTDLRTPALDNCTGALTGGEVCNEGTVELPITTTQRMTTFTLGLGVDGKLAYAENYIGGGSTDYNKIVNGTLNWPNPITDSGPARIDDLWHAAVNGRGSYFSASTPDSLVRGITNALASVEVRDASSSAAATSNLEPVQNDNFIFLALYRTMKWDGDLRATTIDPSTGEIAPEISWSAQAGLDPKVSAASDTRTIYKFDSSTSSKLNAFSWAALTTTEKGYFNNICASSSPLSQCTDSLLEANLTQTQRDMISGENLLKFIRGQTGFEDQNGNANRIYRDREHVLGDMISSQPVYVKAPPFKYADTNYAAFRDSNARRTRTPMVYVAANDGMLHAFEATTGLATSGTEKWAYIPPMVMPKLYKLADRNYATRHQFFVDGSPTVGDICPNAPTDTCSANEWKTILVGGLNAGGKGYYALDITDPENPKGLWNFTPAEDADVGLSFGNPVITKRQDGTWVVAVTSGYNNHDNAGNSDGKGKGHLYLLNANTGSVLVKLSTTAGSATTPSGLAKINGWVDSVTDNTAKRFYGGDLMGNVWRFDTDNRIAPEGNEALLLAQLGNVGTVGNQPVTTKPELTEVSYGGVNYAVVNIGTGRYLGASDLNDRSQQSIYSLKDNLNETGLGLVRNTGVLVQQTLLTNEQDLLRTTSTNAVDWRLKSGWFVDLNPGNMSPGERVNVDMQQQLGLLTVAGNVPDRNACTPDGYAWLYSLDFKTGQYVQSATNATAGRKITGIGLIAGLKTVKLITGKTTTFVTGTSGELTRYEDPSSNPGTGNGAKRVSWRELAD